MYFYDRVAVHVGVKTDGYAAVGAPGRLRSVDRRSSCDDVVTVRFSGGIGEMFLSSPIRFQIGIYRDGSVRRRGGTPVRRSSHAFRVIGQKRRRRVATGDGALGSGRQERPAAGLVAGRNGRQDGTWGELWGLGESGDGIRRGELESRRAATRRGGVRVLHGVFQVVLLVFVLLAVVGGSSAHFTSRYWGDEKRNTWNGNRQRWKKNID